MTPDELKKYARHIGLDELRITRPTPQTWEHYQSWIQNRYHGEMNYLADRLEERRNPSSILPATRSILVAAQRYLTIETGISAPDKPFHAAVSRYAWGEDYHAVMGNRLQQLVDFIHHKTGKHHQARWCVDTAPLLEKDFAAQAGIGWIGKHTNCLSRTLGNWFFLGAILTTLELEPDPPADAHCGTCTRCLDVCPTRAFLSPYVLDARRCISYLTIELKGPIPREFRRPMGQRIFGCDDCLEVCPWNRFAIPTDQAAFHPRPILQTPDLLELMQLTEDDFRNHFKNSPIKRTKRRGLLRNVAVALGNTHDPRAIPVLANALNDPESLIRGHAAWALGEIGGEQAYTCLMKAKKNESDAYVQTEIQWALGDGKRFI